MKIHHLRTNPVLCFLLLFSSYAFAQPVNNACASATNLTVSAGCGAVAGQSLFQATNAGSPTSPYGTTYDIWYRFTPAAGTSSVQIALSGTGAGISNTNTFIEAYNSINCAGISTTTSIGIGTRQTGLTLSDLSAGTQYYFRVFTNTNPTSSLAAWAFSICLSNLAAPGNDNCAGATALTVGTVNSTGRVAGATATAGIPVGCATGTPDDDVWFRFTATAATANITVNPNPASGASSTLLASGGAMLQLLSGNACGTFASLACGDRGSLYATGLAVGTQYYIRVYSSGAFGTNPTAAPTSSGLTFSILVSVPATATVTSSRMNEMYRQTTLSLPTMLNDPWEITYGPDGYLWITEAKGYRILRMDPNTGARTTVLDLGWNSNFFTSAADRNFNLKYELAIVNPQGGMAGMAIHPKFLDATTPKNYVYVSYVQSYGGGSSPSGIFYVTTVARFTYNTGTAKLESPVFLCDTLPGSSDHNSQRMIIKPVGGVDYLFYAVGDMGAGQFGNAMRTIKSQQLNSYEGKILRFNLESDGDAGLQAWIPNDNPFNVTLGLQSAVWARGIRNNQGFAYDTANDILYGSSHGPFSDDEINIIESGKNYGHPLVIGYAADDNANGTTAGASPNMNPAHPSSCPVITDESNNATALGAAYKDPLFAGYPNSVAFPSLNTLWNTTSGANAQWPSEGWSGLDLYTHTLIPGWKQSLVAASLKWGRLVKIRLNGAGTALAPIGGTDTISYFGSTNRFRDLAFAPNGKDMFVIMDRSTTSSGPSAGNPIVPACPGCLQKYTFLGYSDVGGKSTIPTTIDVADGTINTCNTGTTVTIDDLNNNLWVPITGPDGNIMAEINAMGQNLGAITSSFYKNSGAIRVKAGIHYLDRSMTITPAVTSFGTPVKVRLYISKAEFDALDADPLSGLTGTGNIGLLRVLKNSDACAGTVTNGTTLLTPTNTGADLVHGSNGYVLQVNVTGFSTFYFATSNMSLPVTLLSFTGSLQNNATLLNWETANEINTSHFVVERSTDNANFDEIGTVAANGTTSSNTNYTYTDNDVATLPSNVIYYRLRMVDIDGSSKYSNTIVINLADVAGRVSVYPNPASHSIKVMITAVADGKGEWKITDNSGRVVMQNTTTLRKGNNNVEIDINKLAAGLYYLNVSGSGIDQKVKVQKL
jgi:trimeric autotransporter adhesin